MFIQNAYNDICKHVLKFLKFYLILCKYIYNVLQEALNIQTNRQLQVTFQQAIVTDLEMCLESSLLDSCLPISGMSVCGVPEIDRPELIYYQI